MIQEAILEVYLQAWLMPHGSQMNLPTSVLPIFLTHTIVSKVKWLVSAPNFGGSYSAGILLAASFILSGTLGKVLANTSLPWRVQSLEDTLNGAQHLLY